ncbi:MAG: cytochrome b/b6 domain-containing protein [Magnetococcales bacterium]|nr:cytochrome b/b6 domain-containing protein [Magnetococcales bacterium]
MNTTPVWDLPTRLFHWSLVVAVAVAWFTHESAVFLPLHVLSGSVAGGLVLFRLYWGFFGNGHARFADFIHSPRAVFDYLLGVMRLRPPRYLGHNPPGSWAILLMLGLVGLLVATGFLVLGASDRQGPLAGWFSFAWGRSFKEIHETLAFTLLAIVALHILGVLVESLLHRENLITAMIHGRKPLHGQSPAPAVVPGARWGAVLLAAALLLPVLLWFPRPGGVVGGKPAPFFVGAPLAQNALWDKECGDCHLAYHPSLLPAASWKPLMDRSHFNEDLDLDEAVTAQLLAFAEANAAERQLTKASYNMLRSLQKTGVGQVMRITETPYWKRKHRNIADAVFKDIRVGSRLKCEACHQDAREGTFQGGAMAIPSGSALAGKENKS